MREPLLRRAMISVALQTALSAALVVVVVAAIVYGLESHARHRSEHAAVRNAVENADDVSDPPPGIVLLSRDRSGRQAATPGAPAAVSAVDVSTLPLGYARRELGGSAFETYTSVRPDGTRFSAFLDLRVDNDAAERLFGSLLVAGAIGVGATAALGAVVGRRAARPLADALALQRRFVADASHELRTPLAVLHTRAQLISRGLAHDDPRVRAHVDRLAADTHALGEVVEDLLISAELEHRPERSEIVDVAALVTDTVASFEPYADEQQVALATSTEGPAAAHGAPAALRRALSALIDNALAHEHPGGTIEVSVRRERNELLVSVVDDGSGLDPSTRDEITRRFARGADASAGHHGRRFGLGLALVREIVKAHGGRLLVDGAPGRGATFTIALPVASTTEGSR